jgi:serine/threonine protein kinase
MGRLSTSDTSQAETLRMDPHELARSADEAHHWRLLRRHDLLQLNPRLLLALEQNPNLKLEVRRWVSETRQRLGPLEPLSPMNRLDSMSATENRLGGSESIRENCPLFHDVNILYSYALEDLVDIELARFLDAERQFEPADQLYSRSWVARFVDQLRMTETIIIIFTAAYRRLFNSLRGNEPDCEWQGPVLHRELLLRIAKEKTILVANIEASEIRLELPPELKWLPRHGPIELKLTQHRSGAPAAVNSWMRNKLSESAIFQEDWPVLSELYLEYENRDVRDLAEILEASIQEKENLVFEGKDSALMDEKILILRRLIRTGPLLKVGDILAERFKVIGRLGQGGFGIVYKAIDRKTSSVVALKICHNQYSQDRSHLERFFRGAREMSALGHESIARVILDHCVDGGYHFFAMEYVDGYDLRGAVLEGKLSENRALRIIIQVGAALQYAHSRGIVHRDVKPANILLSRKLEPKLTDFDLVWAGNTTGGTQSGIMGTFLYSAPEMWMEPGLAGPAADQYSLAMTLCFVLYGADLPIEAVLRDPGGFVRNLSVSRHLKSSIERGLKWNPEERFASVGEFCEALRTPVDHLVRIADSPIRKAALRMWASAGSSSSRWDLRKEILHWIVKEADPLQAIDLLARIRRLTTRGSDLFFISELLAKIASTSGVEYVSAWARSESGRLFDHLRAPPDLDRLVVPLRDARGLKYFRPFWCPVGADGAHWFDISCAPISLNLFSAFDPKIKADIAFKEVDLERSGDHPVTSVSYYDASSFVGWLCRNNSRVRLPRAHEWYFAACGGVEWGKEIGSQLGANLAFEEGMRGRTSPLGEFVKEEQSVFGAVDFIGNVWEWCESDGNSIEDRELDGRVGKAIGDSRRVGLVAGGSWRTKPDELEKDFLRSVKLGSRSADIGFRCLREARPIGVGK